MSNARCGRCREVVRFAIDKIGKVYEICPVCHEGKNPTFVRKPEKQGSRLCFFEGCANGYEPTKPRQRYCSDECRVAAKALTLARIVGDLPHRKCEHVRCREWFKPMAANQRFCKRLCKKRQGRIDTGKSVARTAALNRAAQRGANAKSLGQKLPKGESWYDANSKQETTTRESKPGAGQRDVPSPKRGRSVLTEGG